MKTTLFILGLVFLFTLNAFAGFPPTTTRGESEISKTTTFNLTLPAYQQTPVGAGTSRIETGNNNLLRNPSFESNTSAFGWTLTAGSGSKNVTDYVDGVSSQQIVLSAVTGTVIDQSVTYTNMVGINAELGIWVKSSATTLQVCSLQGSTEIQCNPYDGSNAWRYVVLNLPFPSSGSIGVRLKTTGSTTATVLLDGAYLGRATNVGSGNIITEWQDFPSVAAGTLITAATTNPTYGTIVTNKAQWRRVGGEAQIRWAFHQSTAGTNGSGIYFLNIPSVIGQIDTSKAAANSNTNSTQFANMDSNVGTFAGGVSGGYFHSGAVVVHDATRLKFHISYTGAAQGAAVWNSGNQAFDQAEQSVTVVASVPIVGWSSGQIIRMDSTNYGWTQYTPTLGAGFGTVTNNVAFHRRNGEMLQVRGSFTSGTVSAAAASISLPSNLSIDSTKVSINNTTANTGPMVGYWDQSEAQSNTRGSIITATGTSTTLVYIANSDRNVSDSLITTTVTNSLPSSVVVSYEFEVPISGWTINQNAPLLVGGVTSGATGLTRIETAKVTSAGVVTEGGGSDWLNGSCGLAGSVFTCNFNAGIFSAEPQCFVQMTSNAGVFGSRQNSISSSQVVIETFVTTTGGGSAVQFALMCVGMR